jgi:hypothetical protein
MKYMLMRIGKFTLILLSLGLCLAGVWGLTNLDAIVDNTGIAGVLVLVFSSVLAAGGFIVAYAAIAVWRGTKIQDQRRLR